MAAPIVQKVPITLDYTGTTRGREDVELRARVRGFIDKRNIEGGRRVKPGDVIFTIDARPFVATANEMKADIAAKQSALKLSEIDLGRKKDLASRSAASAFEVETAQATYDTAVAQLNLSKAKLDQASLDVEYTEVKSSITGRLSMDLPEVGSLVDVGTLLGTVVDDSTIYARYNIDEAYLLNTRRAGENRRPGEDGRPTLKVLMGLGSGTDYPYTGSFYRASNMFDAQTGTVSVDAIYANPNFAIVPGLFCRVRAVFGEANSTLVPQVSILADFSNRYVLVVNDKNVVERRNVQVGKSIGRYQEIVGGDLKLTDQVIVNGVSFARENAAVNPQVTKLDPLPVATSQPATEPPATMPTAMMH